MRLKTRKEFAEQVNKMFGTDISVSLRAEMVQDNPEDYEDDTEGNTEDGMEGEE